MPRPDRFQQFYRFASTRQYEQSRRLIAELWQVNARTGRTVDLGVMADELGMQRDNLGQIVRWDVGCGLSSVSPDIRLLGIIDEKRSIRKKEG